MKNIKFSTKFFAIIFCVLFVVNHISSFVFAEGIGEAKDISAQIENEAVYIIDEDITRRSEFEKHFVCSDGTCVAVSYSEPIHWKNGSTGLWENVDATLTMNNDTQKYEVNSGDFCVALSAEYDDEAVSMTNKELHTISWKTIVKCSDDSATVTAQNKINTELISFNKANISLLSNATDGVTKTQCFIDEPSAFALPNTKSVVQYNNVFSTANADSNVSLRYSVSQYKVEEDIIISDKSVATDYGMVLNVGELVAEKTQSGSVLLKDTAGKTQFTVGIPFMYDSNYDTCYDINVNVVQKGSLCIIEYVTDKEWLQSEDRAYPVVFDPAITSREYSSNIIDTYVSGLDFNNHSSEPNLTVGIKNGELHQIYIKISQLPTLPADVMPLSANLTINHGSNTTTGRDMQMHRVISDWDVSTINMADAPLHYSTPVDTCPFNVDNVSFTLTQADIELLYDNVESGTNYGYMIRYTNTSNVNPDYNVLRSMEYPTASERPVFSVSYSYVLPAQLSTGVSYSFKNANSSKYLTVSGGTDANNVNVIQYTKNSSVSQQFELEATGNGHILRSMVGTQTRVLDIYKVGGYVVDGCNVQIYTNVDLTAQEWLIIPVDNYCYKIVPRSAPNLALTAYGTSNGTSTGNTTTSTGNVYLSEYSYSLNQKWYIETTDGTTIAPTPKELPNGTYILNSRATSGYLRGLTSAVALSKGKLADLGENSVKWTFTYMSGKYVIRHYSNPSLYLACSTNSSSKSVSLTSVGGSIPDRCLWTVSLSDDGVSMSIKDMFNRYLCADGSIIQLLSAEPSTCDWRYVAAANMKELTSFSISNMTMELYDTVSTPSITKNPTGSSFASFSDFTMTTASSNVSLTRGASSYKVYGSNVGNATITVTHKTTNISKTFTANINKYVMTIGLSTSAYGSRCKITGDPTLNSEFYGHAFLNKFSISDSNNFSSSVIWHAQNANGSMASKDDFKNTSSFSSGTLADSSDLVIYMGHGLSASRGSVPSKGNFLHFYSDNDGSDHPDVDCTHSSCYCDCYNNHDLNLYTSEVSFGSETSRLRWALLYSCNFLNTNDYVCNTREESSTKFALERMMTGAHIVMGYSTQAYLCQSMMEQFGLALSSNKPIIDSFFIAGDQGEGGEEAVKDNHIQVALYMDGARYENICSVPVDYGTYLTNEVKMITNGIKDNDTWE